MARNLRTGEWEVFQVGRMARNGQPVRREFEAIFDLMRAGLGNITFIPYNLRW
jgi:hypothetical protein